MENRNIKSRCIFQKDNRVLLCRTIGEDYYFFPGGSVMEGESPEETLRREIKEEFNSGIKNVRQIGIIENKSDGYDETITMFTADLIDPEIYNIEKTSLADGAKIEAEWVPVDDIKNMKVRILPDYDYLSLLQ